MKSLRIDDLHFVRWEGNPIMAPQGDSWEAKDVFNPAAIVREGRVHLLYRAEDFSGADSGTARVELGWLRAKTGCTLRAMPSPLCRRARTTNCPAGAKIRA